jgi:hypothetical protein
MLATFTRTESAMLLAMLAGRHNDYVMDARRDGWRPSELACALSELEIVADKIKQATES